MERAELIAVLEATGCAARRGEAWFLCNPRWTAPEREHAERLMDQPPAGGCERGWLGIPTGGSSGGLKFARHDEATLSAAVWGFGRHFGLERVNAIDVLPPFHVSGLLARLRSQCTGGAHRPWAWRQLEEGERPALGPGDWVISLVPTQLERLLRTNDAVAWLREFRTVLLGGGPAWPDLLEQAAAARLPLAPSYGMTETAAMVTALHPGEFAAGARDSGTALPHAQVTIDAGVIVVESEAVCRGYWPEWREERRWATEDLGEVDTKGHLRVLGRRDAVIITGGEKVVPAEVESVLRSTGEFEDVAVIGVPDAEWGEAVVACHPRQARAPDWPRVRAFLEQQLSAFKRPKRFVEVAPWPRSGHGKLNRAMLRTVVLTRTGG
jgi:O-succinylbenzoic acid--CoA ligase